jgi:hypothetical protein
MYFRRIFVFSPAMFTYVFAHVFKNMHTQILAYKAPATAAFYSFHDTDSAAVADQ